MPSCYCLNCDALLKVALQLNPKQLQTGTLRPPSQINNSSGKQVQIYRVVMSNCRDVGTPFTLCGA